MARPQSPCQSLQNFCNNRGQLRLGGGICFVKTFREWDFSDPENFRAQNWKFKKTQHTETHRQKSVANLNLLAFSDLTHAMERRNYSPERSLMLSSRCGIGIKLDAPPNPAKPCLVEHLNLERGLGLLYPWRDLAAAAAKSLQSCLTLCDPRDGSPPGSPVPGILQARTPKWVAISFSSAWKWKVKVKSLSRVRLLATPCAADRFLRPWDFPGKSTGAGCHCLLRTGTLPVPNRKVCLVQLYLIWVLHAGSWEFGDLWLCCQKNQEEN